MSKKSKNVIMRYLLVLPLLLVFVTGMYATEAQAGPPIGISKIEDCLINEAGFNCDNKTVITVPISYGLEQKLEAVKVTMIQKEGEPQRLEETLEITIEKSEPIEIYPLRHYHTVPYFPKEQVIQVPHPLSGCEGCIDCWDADFPTCGYTFSGSYKIPESRGFCVEKMLEELERACPWVRGEELLDGSHSLPRSGRYNKRGRR